MTNKSRKKKSISKGMLLAVFLGVCFFAALTVYFVRSVKSTKYENAVYSTMEEPGLPVIYAVSGGLTVNPMRGHFQDMGTEAADTVTIVPSDRKMEILIRKYGNSIAGISYEIWNMKQDHFIEKTVIQDFRNENETVSAILPIQNLIEKDTQYLLCITLDTGENRIQYYTRIIWTEEDNASSMLLLAKEFNEKTFDYEEARALTQYMETDPKADNENLGKVTIGSSFSQLTWGETGMKPDSEPEIYMRDYTGMMGTLEVVYRTKTETAAGEEHFVNTDEFNMRIGAERIYIMNYERSTYEIFDGSKHRFSGKMIMLGITDPGVLATLKSESGQYIAYKTDKELWCYDQKGQKAVNIFSFRSRTDDGVRSDCRDHDLKILSVSDDGTVDFAVYGYMNRGRHEGWNGLVYYSYSPHTGVTTENFFIPFARAYEKIKEELSGLCAKGGSDMFFFKQNDTVIAVDLRSLEMMEVVSGLSEDAYASDPTQSRFAWLENGDSIKVMNITKGTTQSIDADSGDVLQILTFSGSDLVTGVSGVSDTWYNGKRVRSLPFYEIRIYDEDLTLIKSYSKNGLYMDDFEKISNRFLFNIYKKTGKGSYVKKSSDTIICTETEDNNIASLAMATTSGEKQRVYYVNVDDEIRNTKNLSILVPESISYENSGNVEIRAEKNQDDIMFYAYANGHLVGKDTNFADALNLCYDDMGILKDENGVIIYSRTDRSTYHTIKDPAKKASVLTEDFTKNMITQDNQLIIDATGATLNQVLNFVYKDCPVAALKPDGEVVLIYGYDAKVVKLWYEDHTETVTREEADTLFSGFLCFTSLNK